MIQGSGRGNQRSYGASAGLTWSMNRYLDLEADASYERTRNRARTDEETARLGLGPQAAQIKPGRINDNRHPCLPTALACWR
jgi:hypothetical protein